MAHDVQTVTVTTARIMNLLSGVIAESVWRQKASGTSHFTGPPDRRWVKVNFVCQT